MERPLKLFAYRLGRELHLDVDVIMSWQLDKIYEYMAFYMTEQDSFKEEYEESKISPEQRANALASFIGAK